MRYARYDRRWNAAVYPSRDRSDRNDRISLRSRSMNTVNINEINKVFSVSAVSIKQSYLLWDKDTP